jgi:hypothetical protein
MSGATVASNQKLMLLLLRHSWVSIPALPYLGFLSFRPTTVD